MIHGCRSAFLLGRGALALPASLLSQPGRLCEALLTPERYMRSA